MKSLANDERRWNSPFSCLPGQKQLACPSGQRASSLPFPERGEALVPSSHQSSPIQLLCSGLGLELQTPSSVTQSWHSLGAQARNPEEGSGCLKRTQDTEDCRGLWEDCRGPSEPDERTAPLPHSRAALGKSTGRQEQWEEESMCRAQRWGCPRLGLQPCGHPGTNEDTGVLSVGPRLLGLHSVRPGPGSCQEEGPVLGWTSGLAQGFRGGGQEPKTQL